MAEQAKLTPTKLATNLREKIVAILTTALLAEGLAPDKSAGGTVLFEMPNELGDEQWAKVEVVIPKGSREGEPFDGQALIDEYKDGLKLAEEKAKLREQASKEKQAKRAEKDKAKAEAKAKADAEDAEPAEEVPAE